MKWIQNLAIQTKFTVAFLLIGILVMVAGFMGYQATQTMAINAEKMYNKQFVPLEYLLRLNDNFQRSRVYALNFQLITDGSEVEKMKKTLVQIDHRFDSITALYKTSIEDAEEQQYFDKYNDSLKFFRESFGIVIRLAEQGLRDSAAMFYRRGAAADASRGMYQAVNGLINVKTKQAENAKNLSTKRFAELRIQLVIISIGAFLLALGFGLLLARIIGSPIKQLENAATRVAAGETHLQVNISSKDELGNLASGFNAMVANIDRLLHETRKSSLESAIEAKRSFEARQTAEEQQKYLAESVAKMLGAMDDFSQGNLTVRLPIERQDEIGRLFQGFNDALDNICIMIERIKDAVLSTVNATNEISSNIGAMSANARKQTERTKDVTASVSEIAESISASTVRIDRASQIAREAGDAALEGERVVQKILDSIQQIVAGVLSSAANIQALNESSSRITEIVQVIQEIADQTNLLALNAAIEAARAGDAGRGFAVVADEVRKLAEKTSSATKEIVKTIDQVRRDTSAAVSAIHKGSEQANEGKDLAGNAGNALKTLIGKTNQVTNAIKEVAEIGNEQTAGSEQIRRNLSVMNDVTRASVEDSERIIAAIAELNDLTSHLENTMEQFTVPAGLREASRRLALRK